MEYMVYINQDICLMHLPIAKNHTIQELSRKQFLVFQMYKNIFVLQVLFQSAQNRLSRFEKRSNKT